MVSKDNDKGMDDEKAFLHSNRWYVYMNKKWNIMKVGYSMEVFSSNGRKVLWEVVYNHILEGVNDHYEIEIRGVGFWFFWQRQGGGWLRRIEWVSLFINVNEDMAEVLKESYLKYEYEVGLVQ